MTLFVSSFFLFMLLGVPIVFVLGLAAAAYLIVSGEPHLLLAFPQRLIVGVDQFVLLTIPLFILAGSIMNVGGISDRIIGFAQAVVGHMRGGLSHVTVMSNVFMAGVSGSATADAAAIGSVMIPAMRKAGYSAPWAAALVAISSLLGPIIPPSIAMIVYGALSSTSIGALFAAGIVPGLLAGGGLLAYCAWYARRQGFPQGLRPTMGTVGRALVGAIPMLMLPVIILVGIRWGVITPTEVGAVAVAYAMILAMAYRQLTWRRLYDAFLASAIMTAGIMFVIAMASIVSFVLGIERIPQQIVAGLSALTDERWAILLLINLVLLALGCFLDPISAMIITLPVLVELAKTYAIDPVHLGVIVCVNLVIGMGTPPVGLCLFIVCAIGKVSLEAVSRAALPMLAIWLGVLMLVTYVPEVALFVPHALGF